MITGIPYSIRESARARHVRITVHRDGRVVVTRPRRVPLSATRRFVESKTDWILKRTVQFRDRPDDPLLRHSRADYLKHREEVRRLVFDRLEQYNSYYGFSYNTVSIKDLTSRWGSCSRRKNLNFNYKIIFLPKEAQDYIIVHELCHLAELNHGPRFWKLVGEQVPDYIAIKKSLRRLY